MRAWTSFIRGLGFRMVAGASMLLVTVGGIGCLLGGLIFTLRLPSLHRAVRALV